MSKSRNIKQLVRNISGGVLQIKQADNNADHVDHVTPDVTTPLSPSSKFTTSAFNIPGQNLIHNIVLSHWDNILGPKVMHVWNLVPDSVQHSATLNQVTSQTLSGEICRDVYNSNIDFKFYDLPSSGIFVAAFVFTATGVGGPGVHALSVLFPKCHLQFYLKIHTVFRTVFSEDCG